MWVGLSEIRRRRPLLFYCALLAILVFLSASYSALRSTSDTSSIGQSDEVGGERHSMDVAPRSASPLPFDVTSSPSHTSPVHLLTNESCEEDDGGKDPKWEARNKKKMCENVCSFSLQSARRDPLFLRGGKAPCRRKIPPSAFYCPCSDEKCVVVRSPLPTHHDHHDEGIGTDRIGRSMEDSVPRHRDSKQQQQQQQCIASPFWFESSTSSSLSQLESFSSPPTPPLPAAFQELRCVGYMSYLRTHNDTTRDSTPHEEGLRESTDNNNRRRAVIHEIQVLGGQTNWMFREWKNWTQEAVFERFLKCRWEGTARRTHTKEEDPRRMRGYHDHDTGFYTMENFCLRAQGGPVGHRPFMESFQGALEYELKSRWFSNSSIGRWLVENATDVQRYTREQEEARKKRIEDDDRETLEGVGGSTTSMRKNNVWKQDQDREEERGTVMIHRNKDQIGRTYSQDGTAVVPDCFLHLPIVVIVPMIWDVDNEFHMLIRLKSIDAAIESAVVQHKRKTQERGRSGRVEPSTLKDDEVVLLVFVWSPVSFHLRRADIAIQSAMRYYYQLMGRTTAAAASSSRDVYWMSLVGFVPDQKVQSAMFDGTRRWRKAGAEEGWKAFPPPTPALACFSRAIVAMPCFDHCHAHPEKNTKPFLTWFGLRSDEDKQFLRSVKPRVIDCLGGLSVVEKKVETWGLLKPNIVVNEDAFLNQVERNAKGELLPSPSPPNLQQRGKGLRLVIAVRTATRRIYGLADALPSFASFAATQGVSSIHVIEHTRLTPEENVLLALQTDILIGGTGGGLTWLLLMKPNRVVVELGGTFGCMQNPQKMFRVLTSQQTPGSRMSRRQLGGISGWNMVPMCDYGGWAEAVGLRHLSVRVPSTSAKDISHDIHVTASVLKNILRVALCGLRAPPTIQNGTRNRSPSRGTPEELTTMELNSRCPAPRTWGFVPLKQWYPTYADKS